MLLDPNPPQFPPPWAVAYGEDGYGLWAAFRIADVRQVMRWIPPGRFWMGSPQDEPERENDETRHLVTLTRGYWLAETACPQALWQAARGRNSAYFKTTTLEHPVEQVSWDDCQGFIAKANAASGVAVGLRLPTEAEWEYACRAGTNTPFSFGSELTPELANYDSSLPYAGGRYGEYRQRTVPVQRFQPNPWGLYQMHGNVWEWCADWYCDYPEAPVDDPEGRPAGRLRVLRGGSWLYGGRLLRSSFRLRRAPDLRLHGIGFRLAAG